MDKLQILFFFIGGYLISRAFIKVHLPHKLVRLLLGESHNSLTLTLLYLLGAAALLSLFIPNALTLLTLLPVLELLSRAFREQGDHRVPTLLTLAVLYGANIGGMGSVTGTPSNLLFVGYMKAHEVPGVESISFLSWLLWGVPLVILVGLLAWGLLCLLFQTWREDTARVHLPFTPKETEHPWQGRIVGLTLIYLGSSILLSFLLTERPHWQIPLLLASAALTVGIFWYLFLWRGPAGEPLLGFRDTYSGLPKKGLELVAVVVLLGGLMYLLNVQDWLASQAGALIPAGLSLFALLLGIALITSFITEVLSNTLIQLAMFLVVLPLAQGGGFPAAPALLVITLSCTCAFMSPIATPVNALAFGGVSGMSLGRMLVTGAAMNLVAGLAITAYVMTCVDFGLGH